MSGSRAPGLRAAKVRRLLTRAYECQACWSRRSGAASRRSARRCCGAAALAVWIRCGPMPAELLDGVDTPSTVVVDRHGRVLYEALSAGRDRGCSRSTRRACRRCSWRRRSRRRIGASTRTPASIPMSLVRAARHNLVEGQIVEGGSTITQQVAKLLIQRREGVDASRLPRRRCARWCSRCGSSIASRKREILALYLNLAPYGNQTTGAGRASQCTSASTPRC